ncbi:hypothetical protein IRP63_15010 (plasmid) [Clostridium botulinum]|uniref:DUF6998 domain-containing protein n=1 Tax=Clostridium botulinum C/D str. DC5 TaxID=1443128 RepID=A0A0A0HYA5_CLOBO|nr:hypothetical protein [Clostridium botulinum]KEH99891.1 hypothetical protein Z952_p0224 [Clostridium botulinum C/D str. BKT75002]KEI05368.1 hypothetical protein Z954_0224 [Clostridium botulinum C/D str. BKT2873]KGM93393.1 hypothetical protein Z955_15625 [Clostridium botulinum C/D str. DC5]KOC56923.1 hypothetical protein ADU89_01645 [Clostridium botulinum]KOC57398.1 hypothetical protein ADU90_06185 [Clostridium botulinum]
MNIEQMPFIIQELYSIVSVLEASFKGRKFTPHGHLAGSIGEVLASYYYDLELLPCSTKTHAAKTKDNKFVKIKVTQGKSIGISSKPDYLIVIKILPDGSIEEIYNGSGYLAWHNTGKTQRNGQRSISINKLNKLMEDMPINLRIPRVK